MCVQYNTEERCVLKSHMWKSEDTLRVISLAITWVLKIKLGLSGLVASTLTYRGPFLASHCYLFGQHFLGRELFVCLFPLPLFLKQGLLKPRIT